MNQIWSNQIQGIDTLYLSRKLRFADEYQKAFQNLFGIQDCSKESVQILEIGCGPGALAESLQRWYPKAKITGIDRDSEFIEFARRKVKGVTFLTGDAVSLPFADASFDVTISNTVCEHIEPSKFYREQMRVLKPGGICLVLSSRKGISISADCLNPTEAENRFWERAMELHQDIVQRYGIGKYALSEKEHPLTMERYGFSAVSVGYVMEEFTPDSSTCETEKALEIIEADRREELEAVAMIEKNHTGLFQTEEFREVRQMICQRYEKRVQLYLEGKHQWDTKTAVIMVVRGEKP